MNNRGCNICGDTVKGFAYGVGWLCKNCLDKEMHKSSSVRDRPRKKTSLPVGTHSRNDEMVEGERSITKKTRFLGDVCGYCLNFKKQECKKPNRCFIDAPCVDYVSS